MKGLFNIPKLELMQNADRMVRSLGSLPQFSSDQTERLHILNAKLPYRHTNRKDYGPQMCRFLDRNEKVRLFTVYLEWIRDVERDENRAARLRAGDVGSSTGDVGLDRLASGFPGDYDSEVDLVDEEDEDEDGTSEGGVSDPQSRALRLEQFARLSSVFLRDGIRDAFSDKTRPQNETTAFILRRDPEAKSIQVEQAAQAYGLPDFRRVLNDYYFGFNRSQAHARGALPFVSINIWSYVRMQMRLLQDNDMVCPPQTVTAFPPCEEKPYGHCNFVLVKDSADANMLTRSRTIGIQGSL